MTQPEHMDTTAPQLQAPAVTANAEQATIKQAYLLAQSDELLGHLCKHIFEAGHATKALHKTDSLQAARLAVEQIMARIDEQIKAANAGKLAEELDELNALAKKHGYKDWDAMATSHGLLGNDKPNIEQPKPSNTRHQQPAEPYDRLLKDEYTGTNSPDFSQGYYMRHGIRPQAGWVKKFENVNGRAPAENDFRDPTDDEKNAMRKANEEAFNSIKRRRPRAKKQ